MSTEEQRKTWIKGYVCAVCNLIHENGANNLAGSILTAGIGNLSLSKLKEMGVDPNDIELLEANQRVLFPF